MTPSPARAAAIALCAAWTFAASTAVGADEATTLTIYSTAPVSPAADGAGGFALVTTEQTATLRAGANRLEAGDLPRTVDPATALLAPIGDGPGIRVLSSQWQPAASTQRVLRAHVGRSVSVTTREGALLTGTLLDIDDGLLLRSVDGTLHAVREYAHVQLPAQGPPPRPQPVLQWAIEADGKGERRLRLSYEMSAMGWWGEYQVQRQAGEACRARIDAAAVITNGTGSGFEAARLWLVAGDVHRARRDEPRVMAMRAEAAAPQAQDVQREALGQYHRYDMGGPWTLAAGGLTRIPLLPQASDVPCTERLVFHATRGWPTPYREPMTRPDPLGDGTVPVSARMEFENTPEAGLGEPVPAGRVRVVQEAAGDTPAQLLGEDSIDHTPRGATVALQLGSAFDLTGKRRQVDFELDSARRQMSETVEIELSNGRDSAATVDVVEDLYRWTGWEIVDASDTHQQLDAGRIMFRVEVPPDGTRTVRYTVRYSW